MRQQIKPTFTPGPLLIGSCYNEVNKVIPKVFAKNGPMFVLVDGEDQATNQANAALISAAPEMYALLHKIWAKTDPSKDRALCKEISALLHKAEIGSNS